MARVMTVNDYLIDPDNYDWSALLGDWAWLLPEAFTVWLVNRLGDPFIVLSDGSVQMLDTGAGRLDTLAESREDFCTKVDEGNNADAWLLIAFVDELVAAGLTLGDSTCYTFVTPPGLGGEYTPENVKVVPLEEHFAVAGQLFEQIKDLPDGAQIRLDVED